MQIWRHRLAGSDEEDLLQSMDSPTAGDEECTYGGGESSSLGSVPPSGSAEEVCIFLSSVRRWKREKIFLKNGKGMVMDLL